MNRQPHPNQNSYGVYSYQQPGNGRPDKRVRLHRRRIWPAVTALVCILALGGFFLVRHLQNQQAINERNAVLAPYADCYFPNITMDGIPLSGKTRAEAEEEVMRQVSARQDSWSLALTYQGHTFITLNYALMGISTDMDQVHQMLDTAYSYGHTGSVDERLAALEQLRETPVSFYSTQSEASDANLAGILSQIAAYFEQAPINAYLASFDPDAADPFTIVPEVNGTHLDVEAAREEIMRRTAAGEGGTFELTPSSLPAQVTVADIRRQVTLLSSATTKIATTSPEGRNSNIGVAMQKINGIVLNPGETFSFNKIVGKRTVENGFVEAIEYVYGVEQPGIGGGVCQVSTTVYLAAVTANLDITERSQHMLKVSYTELGQDATVSGTRLDLAFRNSTDGVLYIVARVENQPNTKKRWQCTVKIYGPSYGDNVNFRLRTEVDDVLLPGEPIIRKDTERKYVEYEDEMYQYQTGREGYVVTTYLDRYVDGEVVSSRKLYTDTYNAINDGYYVGVTPRDEYYY